MNAISISYIYRIPDNLLPRCRIHKERILRDRAQTDFLWRGLFCDNLAPAPLTIRQPTNVCLFLQDNQHFSSVSFQISVMF